MLGDLFRIACGLQRIAFRRELRNFLLEIGFFFRESRGLLCGLLALFRGGLSGGELLLERVDLAAESRDLGDRLLVDGFVGGSGGPRGRGRFAGCRSLCFVDLAFRRADLALGHGDAVVDDGPVPVRVRGAKFLECRQRLRIGVERLLIFTCLEEGVAFLDVVAAGTEDVPVRVCGGSIRRGLGNGFLRHGDSSGQKREAESGQNAGTLDVHSVSPVFVIY